MSLTIVDDRLLHVVTIRQVKTDVHRLSPTRKKFGSSFNYHLSTLRRRVLRTVGV